MKSIKDISKLIEDRRSFESRIVKIKQKRNRNSDLIISEVNPILKIMSDVERQIINDMGVRIKYNMSQVSSYISNIDSISTDGKLLKIRESNRDRCGDYSTSYKIPFIYFDMTEEGIIESHIEWTTNKINKKIDKSKRQIENMKKNKIKQLRKELNELT